MPRFTKADDFGRHMKKALDRLQAETLIQVQDEIGTTAISPYKTGRLRSSWFAAEGESSNETAPEGTDRPNRDARELRVDSSKTYHLTNNLDYVQAVALEGKVRSQPPNWFFDFIAVRIPEIQDTAADVVKRRFDL